MGGGDQVKIIERLKELHFEAGQWPTEVIRDREDGFYECPACGGEGSIDAELVHRLHAGCVGMQVYGIGEQMTAMEQLMPLLMEHLPALLEVAEEASVLADCVDRWEESVAAVIGRSPETGMVTKPIRDALAKFHEAKPQ